jgi:hypothetical protein
MSKKGSTFNHEETAKALYERLTSDRASYITRAEDCAEYTIPSLFPKDGSNGSTTFDTPYQSIGARGVNNLGSKLMLALFPPNDTFFRLTPGEEAEADLANQPEMREQVEQALAVLENRAVSYAEAHQYRVTLAEAIKVLVVTGNCLLFLPPKEGGMKLYKLNSYVLQRDALGNVVQLVAMDKIAYAALPDEVKSLVSKGGGQEKKPEDIITVYTHVYLENDVFYSYQEVEGEIVSGSEQQYPKDKTPWIPLRMVKMDGESYGRSFVEEYLGDLKSLEALSKAIVEMSAICANVLFLVNPNGITRPYKLSKAESGAFVPGRIEDVQALQMNKASDLQVAASTVTMLSDRLSFAFMLNSAVQRNGERVTAEEIRYVASELEDTLGGVYSILSQELQLPLVRRLLVQLEGTGQIPDLPDGLVEPTITTGLAAIGRGHDFNKMTTFSQIVSQNPEMAQVINWTVMAERIATGLSIDTTNLVKTPEQLQQEQQQQQMAGMAEKAAPQMAKGMMDQAMASGGAVGGM